jgi:glycosyl hydrolase family 2
MAAWAAKNLPHTIRLRGPWRHDPTSNCFARRFHRPTGLTSSSRVWLAIGGLEAVARVELNGAPLGNVEVAATSRVEITGHLQPTNTLSVWIDPAKTGECASTAIPPSDLEMIVPFAGRVVLEIEDIASTL